jgi:hypothetical protein
VGREDPSGEAPGGHHLGREEPTLKGRSDPSPLQNEGLFGDGGVIQDPDEPARHRGEGVGGSQYPEGESIRLGPPENGHPGADLHLRRQDTGQDRRQTRLLLTLPCGPGGDHQLRHPRLLRISLEDDDPRGLLGVGEPGPQHRP